MEKEVPQLCVENSNVTGKSEGAESFDEEKVVDAEQVKLIYQAPRMFRQSLIYKTQKLFRDSKEKRVEIKMNRSLKEK